MAAIPSLRIKLLPGVSFRIESGVSANMEARFSLPTGRRDCSAAFDDEHVPGIYGKDYIYPTAEDLTTTHARFTNLPSMRRR
jgi:hypothetical protein